MHLVLSSASQSLFVGCDTPGSEMTLMHTPVSLSAKANHCPSLRGSEESMVRLLPCNVEVGKNLWVVVTCWGAQSSKTLQQD